MAYTVKSLKLGTSVNPETQEEVVRVYAVVEGMDNPVKVLGTQDDLKAFGTPAVVCKALLIKEGQYGFYAHLPQIKYNTLTW
jgi:hypothetical protein